MATESDGPGEMGSFSDLVAGFSCVCLLYLIVAALLLTRGVVDQDSADASPGRRLLPSDHGAFHQHYDYPPTEPLGAILSRWNTDDPVESASYREVLKVIDFEDEEQRREGERLLDLELPFKVINAPFVADVEQKWTDEYLSTKLKGSLRSVRGSVEMSQTNHFMYWTPTTSAPRDWKAPTKRISSMRFDAWLEQANLAEAHGLSPNDPHYYYVLGTDKEILRRELQKILLKPGRLRGGIETLSTSSLDFILKDVPILDARRAAYARVASLREEPFHEISSDDPSLFFIRDPAKNKCRIGMRGVIAEPHYDTGRNMIMMLRGKKRYILAPPESCSALDIIGKRSHPSFRHSRQDWSLFPERMRLQGNKGHLGSGGGTSREGLENVGRAHGLETVLRAGEVLYVPTYWFHYITSLEGDISVQCNTRHGPPPRKQGEAEIRKCVGDAAFDGPL